MFRKAILIVGLMILCGGVALAVTYMYDDLAVVGSGGTARIYIQQYDPLFGVPWTALKDRGGVPAELEIAPVPGQYDQATVKTQLAILGVGQYTPGDEVATPPFDARLLMSGPWPYSYCALRDDGSSPATLEVNPLNEYQDVVVTVQNNGMFLIQDCDRNLIFGVSGVEHGQFPCPVWRPQTGYIKVNPAEYVPGADNYSYWRSPYEVHANPPEEYQEWYAPLQLPHNSTVTYVEWHYYDADATPGADLQFFMLEVDGSSVVNAMATGSSTGAPGYSSVSTTSITSPTIDNTNYSYVVAGLMMSPQFAHGLCQVNIHYTYTGPY